MSSLLNRFAVLVLIVFVCTSAIAQPPTTPRDSTRRTPGLGASTQGPRPYKDVITEKAKTDDGLFKVHKIDDKYFFEIPDSLLGRDIMVVNRVAKSSINSPKTFGGYAGDQINEAVIRFEKGPNNKIYLKNVSYTTISKDSSQVMYQAVMNSNIQPISGAFDIKAFSRDSTGSVLDMTDYLNSDNDIIGFSSVGPPTSVSAVWGKSAFQVGGMQTDKSYVSGVKSFPTNIEVSSIKTYFKTASSGFGAGGSAAGSQSNITLQINNSFILLPEKPMQQRFYDSRVGYYSRSYNDYDANPQGVENISMIVRWRIEPKEEDWSKYLKGELVEPKKPILFYIDPSTPKKWIPYLIQGVNDWQGAFEKAGFKNAIMAKEAPVNDSNWSIEDSRYSAIVYKPSPVENAYGPSVTDPRSGEIIESHIGWFHNVMRLIHNWYFVQCAAVDPKARKMIYDDELMGQLIRFVSSHEVGHTLGLRHNYGSSSTVPVEKLRDKAWVEANGHTPSIMDYARFNYVAQPEDNISQAGLFPRIGDYDKWAIEWGYKLFPEHRTADAEKDHLNKWVIERLKDQRLWFGTEQNQDDPRSQREQVGDDAMKGSMYGIKNLQRIVPNLLEWTKQPNEDYSNLNEMYSQVISQLSNYLGHVTKYVGGIMETPKRVEESGPVYEIVSEVKQKEAVDFLNKNLFATPVWIINQDIFSRTNSKGLTIIGNLQDNMLSRLLSNRTLSKLIDAEAVLGNASYQITELFADLKKGIWNELASRKTIDVYRRNLQKSYINMLQDLVNPPSVGQAISIQGFTFSLATSDKSDVKSVVRAHLTSLKNEINSAEGSIQDTMSKYHLQDIAKRIDNILNPKK